MLPSWGILSGRLFHLRVGWGPRTGGTAPGERGLGNTELAASPQHMHPAIPTSLTGTGTIQVWRAWQQWGCHLSGSPPLSHIWQFSVNKVIATVSKRTEPPREPSTLGRCPNTAQKGTPPPPNPTPLQRARQPMQHPDGNPDTHASTSPNWKQKVTLRVGLQKLSNHSAYKWD